jgi:hypothetical protein
MLEDNDGGVSGVLAKLERSNKATSIKTMRQLRDRINALQESGMAIPEALTESYNRLATESNDALKANRSKLEKYRDTFVTNIKDGFGDLKSGVEGIFNIKDGLGDLRSGVEGIFGDVLGQITNNPLFSFLKGFGKSAIGIVGKLLPSLTGGEVDLLDSGSPASELGDSMGSSGSEQMDMLTKIEENTAGLLDIWSDKKSDDVQDKASDKLMGDTSDSETETAEQARTGLLGMFSGFLARMAVTIKTSLLLGALGAFLLNPLTLAIIALIAGLAFLYKKWDEWNIGERLNDLPKLFGELWENYGEEFGKIILGVFVKIGETIGNLIGGIFKDLPKLFGELWENYGEEFGKIILGVFVKIGETIGNLIGGIFGNPDIFKDLGTMIGVAIFDAVKGITDTITFIADSISNLLFSITSTMDSMLDSIVGFLGGRDNLKNPDEDTLALVGENRDKSIGEINKRLYEIEKENSGFLNSINPFRDNDEEDALKILLKNKDMNIDSESKGVGMAGEARTIAGSNVSIQNNSNTSVSNVNNTEAPSIKMASSRSGGGAYAMKQSLRGRGA